MPAHQRNLGGRRRRAQGARLPQRSVTNIAEILGFVFSVDALFCLRQNISAGMVSSAVIEAGKPLPGQTTANMNVLDLEIPELGHCFGSLYQLAHNERGRSLDSIDEALMFMHLAQCVEDLNAYLAKNPDDSKKLIDRAHELGEQFEYHRTEALNDPISFLITLEGLPESGKDELQTIKAIRNTRSYVRTAKNFRALTNHFGDGVLPLLVCHADTLTL